MWIARIITKESNFMLPTQRVVRIKLNVVILNLMHY